MILRASLRIAVVAVVVGMATTARAPRPIRLPTYLRDLLLYRLTLEAQKRVAESPLSKREIVRRLGTSAAQLYRLLDQTNYCKSVDQVLALLQVLNCEVDVVVRTKTA